MKVSKAKRAANKALAWAHVGGIRFTYVLRRWFDDPVDGEGAADKIVVIVSETPLYPDQLLERFELLEAGDAKDFELIEVQKGSGVVLDTWERGVGGYCPPDADLPCRIFRQWWSFDSSCQVEQS